MFCHVFYFGFSFHVFFVCFLSVVKLRKDLVSLCVQISIYCCKRSLWNDGLARHVYPGCTMMEVVGLFPYFSLKKRILIFILKLNVLLFTCYLYDDAISFMICSLLFYKTIYSYTS